jgi:hypothetical protein
MNTTEVKSFDPFAFVKELTNCIRDFTSVVLDLKTVYNNEFPTARILLFNTYLIKKIHQLDSIQFLGYNFYEQFHQLPMCKFSGQLLSTFFDLTKQKKYFGYTK